LSKEATVAYIILITIRVALVGETQVRGMERNSDEVTVVVSELAADALGIPLEELPPLSDAIDIDALESIVSPPSATRPSDVTVTFSYSGLDVFVCSGNVVYVRPNPNGETAMRHSDASDDW
jgi:hypothetical protein